MTQNLNDVKFLFFSNTDNVPCNIDGIDLQSYFKENNISMVKLELKNKTPKDWYGMWRNQFYLFDILEYCSRLEGNILILDSDCFIRKPLTPLFELIEKDSVITYNCGYGIEYNINGISIQQMRQIYSELYHDKNCSLIYCGGEFIGINSAVIPEILKIYKELWDFNYLKYQKKITKLNEEAHFLSLAYYRLGITDFIANDYIKRMWTDAMYDNVSENDIRFAIWHMPAEKKYGFRSFAKWFSDKERTSNEFLDYLDKYFGIHQARYFRKTKKLLYVYTLAAFEKIKLALNLNKV